DRRAWHLDPLRRLRLHPPDPALAPAVRARPEHLLRLLRIRDRSHELRAALVLRRARRRDRARRDGAVRRLRLVPLPPPPRRARRRPRPAGAARPARREGAAARVGADRGARVHAGGERLLPDDELLLLLRARPARRLRPDGVRAPARAVKVAVLTTSYPRHERDVAGAFVRDGVEALRRAGVEVDVVSPASFPHFGIAYGHGVVGNLRRSPWKALLLPAFLLSFARAARRAAREADLVHAHWLPSGLVGLATGKPVVLQLWGTDVELARRAPRLARWVLRRAVLVVAASESLAAAARELGARDVAVVPTGVDVPEVVAEPDEPPHVLYVGRLSEEKGVLELVEAARGLPLVVVGDGPLRDRVP